LRRNIVAASFEPSRLQRADVLGQPIDFLVDVVLAKMEQRARLKLMLLQPAAHEEVAAWLLPAPSELGQRVPQLQCPAGVGARLLDIGVAEDQKVQRHGPERRARQPRVRHEHGLEQVALQEDRGPVVRRCAEGARQPFPGQRRLVPTAIEHALDVVEQLDAGHRLRVAEAERIDGAAARCGISSVAAGVAAGAARVNPVRPHHHQPEAPRRLQAVVGPFLPTGKVLVTTLDNLSLHWQRDARRRNIKDVPERDQIENYESSNDAYVVEDSQRKKRALRRVLTS
jgi:hypothetical protein